MHDDDSQTRQMSDAPTGPDVIQRYLKTLPGSPGVYRMLDASGEVIYVGKARNLKARVSSYTRLGGHANRIARMISATASMEFVSVRTEAEALLLEANLIKRFRPRFNVLMRDDKSFPYILIARDRGADAGGHPKRNQNADAGGHSKRNQNADAGGHPKRSQNADAGGHPKRSQNADAGGHPKRSQNADAGGTTQRGGYAAQIMKHRGARNRAGDYFGPFASAGAVNRTINMLQRAFLLRSCSDSVYDSRTRPCLLHQIKRCAAPCTGEIAIDDYNRLVEEAVRFLRGESQNVREMYQRLMQEASDALEFERAAKYRNRLWALAHVTADQSVNPEGIEEADIFAAHQDGGQTCVQVFFFRSGQNWGNRAYYPRADRSLGVEEVLDAFIAQFYDDKPVPRLILLSHDVQSRAVLAEALATKSDRRVDIRVPQRGTKSALVDHALANAREALGRKLAESSSQLRLLDALGERLGLSKPPRRIEVFDNSHISGTNAVGAMVVAGAEGFVKKEYRRFNIRSTTLTPGDDYAMMREVLSRRFKRLVLEEADEAAGSPPHGTSAETTALGAPPPDLPSDFASAGEQGAVTARGGSGVELSDSPAAPSAAEGDDDDRLDDVTMPGHPDLLLIDGGAGQLAVACEVAAEMGLRDVAIVGVAKGPERDAGREHFHIPGREKPLMLEPRDPVLYFVQRLRDEAHRFAIGAHRARRAKAISANPLDEIAGIGPTRKRALMAHFGSAKAVSRAGVEDLKAVSGISAEMARKIYDFFHERRG